MKFLRMVRIRALATDSNSSHMRTGTWIARFGLMTVVVLPLFLVSLSSPSVASSTTTTVPVYTDFVWVPVVTCATVTGVQGSPAPRSVPPELVKVPSNLEGRVSLYQDEYREAKPLLGPANWDCSAIDAADGTYGITLQPVGQSNGEVVSGSSDGPCASCVFGVACPYLSKTLRKASGFDSKGTICPSPKGESHKIVSMSSDTSSGKIFVSDAPGGAGSLTVYNVAPSTKYSTTGYVIYSVSQRYAYTITCTLPSSQADLCSVIEGRFDW